MSTPYDDIPWSIDEPPDEEYGDEQAPAAPRLRAVQHDERANGDQPERYELTGGKNGPKQEPANVRWLQSRIGAGPLSWAFRRRGEVVRVSAIGEDGYQPPADPDDENGPATVTPLHARMLSTQLSKSYEVGVLHPETSSKPEWFSEEWFPVADCQRALDELADLPYLRSLRGVTHTPLLRAEQGAGVLMEPGYDEHSGMLYVPNCDIPAVPVQPTPDQIAAATKTIRDLVADFRFESEHGEANYIGSMLTPLMRLVTPPPYKLLAINAHQRGSGKSLLAEVLRAIHGGTLRTWPGTEEELGKQITSILSATTAPICQIDNLRGLIRSGTLEALLTTREYTARVLGTTNDTTMVNDRLWVATGNNMALGGDLDRRCVWVTINPGVARPEDRTDFTIKALGRHVAKHRGEILAALLTLLQAWDVAGRPQDEATSDSFGEWVAAVRGILAHAGIPGTFDAADSRRDAPDPDDEEAGQFLQAIYDTLRDGEWSVKGLLVLMGEKVKDGFDFKPSDRAALLLDSLPTSARGRHWRPGQPTGDLGKPLGYWLRNREGQWFDGSSVERPKGSDGAPKRASSGALYRVVQS